MPPAAPPVPGIIPPHIPTRQLAPFLYYNYFIYSILTRYLFAISLKMTIFKY